MRDSVTCLGLLRFRRVLAIASRQSRGKGGYLPRAGDWIVSDRRADVSDIGGPMGHLKLTPPDNVLSPRFTQRLKVEADARLPGTEDITLAKIAERFAP